MINEHEFVLGEDVTAQAKGRSERGTVVLSVRIGADELSRLEQISREGGKSLSQLAREALTSFVAQYGRSPILMTISSAQFTFSTGKTQFSVGRTQALREELPMTSSGAPG